MTYTVVYDEGVVLNNNPISKKFTFAKKSENIMRILGGILLIFLV